MRSPLLSAVAPVLVCLAALACGSPAGDDDGPTLAAAADPSAVVFLAQDAPPSLGMDALYQGRVLRDAQGCLRLEAWDQRTVIWPHGYTLEARGGALRVKDAQGREVGTVGGSFRMGGGEIPSLDYVEHLSTEKRARATESCPGGYWVAAP